MTQTTSDALRGVELNDLLEQGPMDLIAERHRERFRELMAAAARELAQEEGTTPREEAGHNDDMTQRRILRGAAYRAFRQLWSETKAAHDDR